MQFTRRKVVSLLFVAFVACQIPAAAQEVDLFSTLQSYQSGEIEKLAQTNPQEAIRQMRELEKNIREKASPETQRDFLVELISLLVKIGQHGEAGVEIEKLKTYGDRYQDKAATAWALHFESLVLFFEGKLELATEDIEKAIPLAISSGQDALIATVQGTATYIYLEKGSFQVALAHEVAALDALKGNDERVVRERAKSLNVVSQIYASLKDGKRALEYSDKAQALAKSINSPGLVESFASDRGYAYMLLGDTENAEKLFTEALQAARKSSKFRGEMIALANLSNVALAREQYGKCVQYAKSAVMASEKAPMNDALYATYANLGLCHIGMGMVKVGEVEVERGIAGLRKGNDLPDLETTYGELARAYDKAGRYKDAMKALLEQRTLTSSLFQANRDRAMVEMQAKFDASERQQKIELLQEQNKIQSEEIKNKNLQRFVAILSAILVMLMAFVIIREKEQLRRKAHKNNLDKSKFIADAAHDLRQPMQAIGNLLEAAKHAFTRGDTAKSQELVDSAQSAAKSMRSSFNSVLELSRLDSGSLVADYSDFNLIGVINEICLSIRPLADQRGVNIRLVMSKKSCIVRSDRHLLARVLANLLSNAVKYSDSRKGDKATVIIGVVALPGRFRIDVADNGIGIVESEQENIFKPFFQIDNPEQDREKGIGLGLSIVNAIVATLDGHRLTMRSKPGLGTRFSMELPGSSLGVRHIDHVDSTSADVDVAGLYVLYVEDNMLVRKSTEALLHEFGVLCDVSNSLKELAEKLPKLERMPDIVLTDHQLSDSTTAIDVINAVYAEFQTTIPTIVLTGECEDFQYSEGMNGVVVLRKPISPKELLRQIRAAVS